MSVIINTNSAATIAANNLAQSNSMLQKSLNRLSSGSKIVSPADDAGGLAVALKLTATAQRQGAVANNIGDSVSYLQTQDGVLSVTTKVLNRISELKALANDPTKNATDLSNYDSEFTSLQAELVSAATEQFNGVSMFGTTSLNVLVTDNGSTTSAVTLAATDLTSTGTGVGALTATSVTGLASISLAAITAAIQNVATLRATNGAEQSRLGFASDLLMTNKANLESATSRITDVDVAQESTQLARWNILVQSGTAMLTQANQSSQIALKLLGN